MKTLLATLFACALCAQAALAAGGSVLKVKDGSCSFKVMDAAGVKPISKATVVLADTAKGATVAEALTDATGRCKLDISAGHYILKVNGQLMAVVQADAENTITSCHVMLQKPVVVGQGEEVVVGSALTTGSGVTGGTVLGLGYGTAAIVGGAAFVGGAAGAAVVDNQDDDGKSSSGSSD